MAIQGCVAYLTGVASPSQGRPLTITFQDRGASDSLPAAICQEGRVWGAEGVEGGGAKTDISQSKTEISQSKLDGSQFSEPAAAAAKGGRGSGASAGASTEHLPKLSAKHSASGKPRLGSLPPGASPLRQEIEWELQKAYANGTTDGFEGEGKRIAVSERSVPVDPSQLSGYP